MRKQVEAWQQSELTDVTAKVVIYEAFVEGKLEATRRWQQVTIRWLAARSAFQGTPAAASMFRFCFLSRNKSTAQKFRRW